MPSPNVPPNAVPLQVGSKFTRLYFDKDLAPFASFMGTVNPFATGVDGADTYVVSFQMSGSGTMALSALSILKNGTSVDAVILYQLGNVTGLDYYDFPVPMTVVAMGNMQGFYYVPAPSGVRNLVIDGQTAAKVYVDGTECKKVYIDGELVYDA